MPERQIPKELQNEIERFNSAQKTPDSSLDIEVSNALETAISETMTIHKGSKARPEDKIEEPADGLKKTGVLSGFRKNAGNWLRGLTAAVALGVGTEAMAVEKNLPEKNRIEHIEKDTDHRMDELDREMNQIQTEQEGRIQELKKLYSSAIEKKYPGVGKIFEKQCDGLLKESSGETTLEKMNLVDYFGKKVLNNLEKKSSNVTSQEKTEQSETKKISGQKVKAEIKIHKTESGGQTKTTTFLEGKLIGVSYTDMADEILTTDKLNFHGSWIKSESLFRTTWDSELRNVYAQYKLYKENPTPGLKEAIKHSLEQLISLAEEGKAPVKPEIKAEFGIK